jgi:hypothetical protein
MRGEESTMTKGIHVVITRRVCVLVLLAGVLMPVGVTAGAEQDKFTKENTFTKWITTFPNMAGIVGGAVGNGSYAGEILKFTPGTTTVIEALYHFNGARHSFTALVHVEQTGLKAVIIGVVTEGWLKGNKAVGEYTQITCTQAPDGACFQGTLDIVVGTRPEGSQD